MLRSLIVILVFTFITNITNCIYAVESGKESSKAGISTDLPDISIIGNFKGKISSDENDCDNKRIWIDEIEMSFQGYLYPEIRSDVFLAMHRHDDKVEPEICEAYVSFLKTIDALSFKVGKIHVDFGKINKIHAHNSPYVDQPQVITNFFGHHGLVGEGAMVSYLMPLPIFAQLDLGVWKITGHEHDPEELAVDGLLDSNGVPVDVDEILVPGECGREFGLAGDVSTSKLWLSFPLSWDAELEVGGSFATGNGSHYEHHMDEAMVTGLDLTYKMWPSAHSRLIFQTELLQLVRKVPLGEMKRTGFYSYLGYKANKYWAAGLRYDDSEDAFPNDDGTGNMSIDISMKTRAVSFILTRHLTETTKLRLQYKNYIEGPADVNELHAQILFGIGPHSHPLE